MPADSNHPPLPTRLDAIVFLIKSRVLQANRALKNLRDSIKRHPRAGKFSDAPVLTEHRAELWGQASDAEFVLKAGKVQNLRTACRILDGTEIPAGEIFSFWKQLGRTTRRAGYTTGRELRSGCLVPNLGGGLCALSGLLYEAALAGGCEIIERHGHSRILPGMTTDPARDATIFWNYVDLRFRVPFDLHIEAVLDSTHLILRFRSHGTRAQAGKSAKPSAVGHVSGDCLTCGETQCFRHPSANAAHPRTGSHTAYLLDAFTPEFNSWCAERSNPGDRWFLPLDHRRWKKPNYAWTPPNETKIVFATFDTLLRSWRNRRLPRQGATRQRALIQSEKRLATCYAKHLHPCAGHLVISQNLLPHLQQLGALGGRTYDVLVHRLPVKNLHQTLDQAAARHPESATLADFRADASFIGMEDHSLRGATRFITPHRHLAELLGKKATLIAWRLPEPAIPTARNQRRIFLPCSPLGRKGIHELAAALRGTDFELIILGAASEGHTDPLESIRHRRGTVADLSGCGLLVLPAWIEHQPRLALLALASGIPVVATRACGLPIHPLLHEIPAPDPAEIRAAIEKAFAETPASAGLSQSI